MVVMKGRNFDASRVRQHPLQGMIEGYFIDMGNIAKAALDGAEWNTDMATKLVVEVARLK